MGVVFSAPVATEAYGFAGFAASAAAGLLWTAWAYAPLLSASAGASPEEPLSGARYWALAPAAWLCVATFFGAFVAYGGASQTLCAAAPTSSRAAADDHSVSARARARALAQSAHMRTQARTHACASTHGVVPAEADLPLHVANAFTHSGGGARSGVEWAPAGPK